jgi:hypothetical protein
LVETLEAIGRPKLSSIRGWAAKDGEWLRHFFFKPGSQGSSGLLISSDDLFEAVCRLWLTFGIEDASEVMTGLDFFY